MFGIAAVVFFAIAFLLHWGGGGHAPLDVTGFEILGLLCVAVHWLWPWTPWRHPNQPS